MKCKVSSFVWIEDHDSFEWRSPDAYSTRCMGNLWSRTHTIFFLNWNPNFWKICSDSICFYSVEKCGVTRPLRGRSSLCGCFEAYGKTLEAKNAWSFKLASFLFLLFGFSIWKLHVIFFYFLWKLWIGILVNHNLMTFKRVLTFWIFQP